MAPLDDTPHALVVPSQGQSHAFAAMLLSQSLASLGFKISYVYFLSDYVRLSDRNSLALPMPELRGELFLSPRRPAAAMVRANGNACPGPVRNGAVPGILPSATMEKAVSGRGRIDVHVVDDGCLPADVAWLFFQTPSMKDNLYDLVVELQQQAPPPVCLIADSFLPWTSEIAQRAAIPRVEFYTGNALSHLLATTLDVLYADGTFPEKGPSDQWKREVPLMLSHIPGFPPFSSELFPNEIRFADSTNLLAQLLFQVGACVKSGDRILINTSFELETAAFNAYETQGISAYAIGPLPMQMKADTNDQTGCLSWLNTQAESSVIYVAFGSLFQLCREEIQELALGLEASGRPFLWVLREDTVRTEELPQLLPDGFLERIRGTGMIIKWAPQIEVLKHKAVGGFLSHCGWNSTLESMWVGVPLLCLPRFGEQRINCHYICNVWGAGLELERNERGALERTLVEAGVKALMVNEEGRKARRKAKEIMHVVRKTSEQGGQSSQNLQKLYDDMRALSLKQASHLTQK